jgi:hypothetical protein
MLTTAAAAEIEGAEGEGAAAARVGGAGWHGAARRGEPSHPELFFPIEKIGQHN